MKVKFREIRLSPANKFRLQQINMIINEYQRAGYVLTLRQLYYQLVSRDVIPNKQTEYSKLSKLLKEGRMAGIVDWQAIEDRLRVPYTPASWDTPADIMDSVIQSYKKPRLDGQENYLEVWVEKDALSGVLKRVTSKYHVPILVNRGYSSASAMYDSYERFSAQLELGKNVILLYLGDYDPSGIDMIRDVYDRPLEMLLAKAEDILGFKYRTLLQEEKRKDYKNRNLESKIFQDLQDEYDDESAHPDVFSTDEDEDENYSYFDPVKAFLKSKFKVIPIALTRAQITQYNPPPNPAKKTDPRSRDFISKHGTQSWEVDALKPEVLNALLTKAIEDRIDLDKYNKILTEEKIDKSKLVTLKKKLEADDIEPDDKTDFDTDTDTDDEN